MPDRPHETAATPATPHAPHGEPGRADLAVRARRPADVVAKALAGPADVVIVDLEDAVAPDRKDHARAAAAAARRPLSRPSMSGSTPCGPLCGQADLRGRRRPAARARPASGCRR